VVPFIDKVPASSKSGKQNALSLFIIKSVPLFRHFYNENHILTLNPTIQLLKFLLLADYPSGSSINYYEEKFYLIGDDASYILILDKNYDRIDSIRLFTYPEKRIPKREKADFEASTLVKVNGKDHLLVLGSASREERKRVILISLNLPEPYFKGYHDEEFISRLVASGIQEVNIEGVTTVGNQIVLTNRGNASNPKNHLIITDNYFWEKQKEAAVYTLQLLPPADVRGFIGASDVFYLKSNDVLLLTLSSEAAGNSYEDGTIGNSYLGWINDFTQKIKDPEVRLDGLINLSDASKEFNGEKIEGICVESVTNEDCILHLVSDNDKGESKLFKIKMDLKR
jgi:hypothetical protein